MSKISPKLGDNILGMFAKSSDEVVAAGAKWWGNPFKEAAKEADKLKNKTTQEILHGLDESLLTKISDEANLNLRQGLTNAHDGVKSQMESLVTEIKNMPGAPRVPVGATKVQLFDAMTEIDDGIKAARTQVENLNVLIKEQVQRVAGETDNPAFAQGLQALRGEHTKASELIQTLNQARDRVARLGHAQDLERLLIKQDYDAIFRLKFHPDQKIRTYTTNMLGSDLTSKIDVAVHSQKSISPNIGNNRAFLGDYIDLHLADNKMALDAFKANPWNAKKLLQIKKRQPKLIKDIVDGKVTSVPIRKSLTGLTRSETAARLGIGAGALAAGAGAVKTYGWFGDNDPAKVAVTGKSISAALNSIKVTGPGAVILQKANMALSSMTNIANKTSSELATKNAAQAAKSYVNSINIELQKLVECLRQWDVVEANCQDKAAARSVGQQLEQYMGKIASGINELGSQLGESGAASVGAARSDQNVLKIQGFLKIPETGQLDMQTVNSLRNLEKNFNRRAATGEFTGAFVVPEVNHIVSYNDLITAYKKIQKY